MKAKKQSLSELEMTMRKLSNYLIGEERVEVNVTRNEGYTQTKRIR